MNLDPTTDLELVRTIDAPRALLWECWTSPEHIPHFFVPKPHSVTACEIDLRVGGRFNTTFNVDGNEMKNDGVYLEIDPGAKLVFTDAYTSAWTPSQKPFMTVVLTFEEEPDGRTKYTTLARHWTAEDREAHETMGFRQGWERCTDQLAELLQTF